VQFPIGAVLHRSNTPSLRVAGFEDEDEAEDEDDDDDDEDENEARLYDPGTIYGTILRDAKSTVTESSGVLAASPSEAG
jgi:hypothetical protein